ncbi:hypothetical protein AVL50_29710 [Flammeovirga sp. SJP92]|nr:hypothetical protein AVL50_29710 [Flammeovirga sp. SJP92]
MYSACKARKNLFLNNIRGHVCTEDQKVWGDFPKGLDWGDWKPDYPIIGLNRTIINRELILLIQENKMTKALKLYRTLNKALNTS